MLVDIEVPNQGLTITEATLTHWHRQPGETIRKGETLFEIETDKAIQEIEAPVDGTVVARLVNEGDVVPLGKVVAQIGTEASDLQKAATPAADAPNPALPELVNGYTADAMESAGQSRIPLRHGSAGVMVSPRARRAAARLDIDPATIQPTGTRRHVREQDVLRAVEARTASQQTAPISPIQPSSTAMPTAATVVTLNRIRQITALRTTASFRDTPHFYLTREVCAEHLLALRTQIVAEIEEQQNIRISITDLLLKTTALALQAYPSMNAQWNGVGITLLQDIDINLAVNTPDGLVAPILRRVDTLSLVALARARVALTQQAHEGRFKPEDLAAGSFTVSNLGAYGVDQFEAIIVPPQSGILAIGAIKSRPFVIADELAVRKTLFLTLSIDHRVADGVEAARFLDYLARIIEKPALLCAL